VFVGNLSDYTTQGDLQALFAEVGEVVEVFLPSDRATGRPRGFAFIEFGDDAQAAAAIEKFEGHELEGRKIRVTEAEDRRAGGPGGFSGGAGGGERRFPSSCSEESPQTERQPTKPPRPQAEPLGVRREHATERA